MKKVNYIAAGISALTIAGLLLPTGQVFAADINKTSVAEVNIQGEPITLDQVPDLNFGTIEIDKLIAGEVSQPLVDNTVPVGPVKTAADPKDGNATGDLSVTDNRGTNVGWELTAQLGDMKNAGGKALAGSMILKGTDIKTDNVSLNAINPGAALPELVIGGAAVSVWKANAATGTDDGQGQGKNTAVIKNAGGTTLKLKQNLTPTAGQYQAAITWTLADAPK
ncbi:WxL domain-containing protein [Lacticaseibacillus paracasei]|uniref:WxL domain-containing protein n=1 Tax=Lacticaseibacillus paracasei TaxID=1597 RepID=UPI0031F6E2DE